MPNPLIELRGITLRTDDGAFIFNGANLSLYPGERVLVTAPVASGKGVLIRLISGLVRPDEGSVILFGTDISDLKSERLAAIRKRLGLVFQDSILISNLKAVENVALPLLYHTDLPYDDAMARAMELLGLAGYRGDSWALPGPLPQHAKKEVAIARALALEPQALICESLSEGLTIEEQERLAGLLLKYQEQRPESLLVFTSTGTAEASLYRPDRVIRIEGRDFTEKER